MPTNDFKPFAVGEDATVVSQAIYAAASALLENGFQVGIADPEYLNKVWRQSSIMAAVIGQLIVDQTGDDAIDDGTIATIVANLTTAIQTVTGGVMTSNASIVTTGGSTVLDATERIARFITVTGVLASNATLVFPTNTQEWVVINKTTGAYSLTCKTAAGAGVTIKQGGSNAITTNGTDVTYAVRETVTQTFGDSSLAQASTAFVQQAISQVGGYYQDTGVANAYVVALIPAISGYHNGLSFRVRTTHANTTGCTLNAGGGAIQLLREDRSALEEGDVPTGSIFAVTYDDVSGSPAFLINELVPSQLGTIAKLNIGANLYDDGAGNLAATDQAQSTIYQLGLTM